MRIEVELTEQQKQDIDAAYAAQKKLDQEKTAAYKRAMDFQIDKHNRDEKLNKQQRDNV